MTLLYCVDKQNQVALSVGPQPEVWGTISGMADLDYATVSDLTWAGYPHHAFVTRQDALALGILESSLVAAETVWHEVLKDEIVRDTQKHLDQFAMTRGYDGILSACTYHSSAVTKFQVEGAYCVQARDATWAKLYEMLDEVTAGTRPVPSGFADVLPELPTLAWPE